MGRKLTLKRRKKEARNLIEFYLKKNKVYCTYLKKLTDYVLYYLC